MPPSHCFVTALPLPFSHCSSSAFTSPVNNPFTCRPQPLPPPKHRLHPHHIPTAVLDSSSAPPTNLSTALSQISSFQGDKSQARNLVTSLINTFSTPKATPEALPKLFQALREASLLPSFASLRHTHADRQRKQVSAEKLAAKAGLPLSALSPRRSTVLAWQFAGVAVVVGVVQLANAFGVGNLARPLLIGVGGALLLDQIVLKGVLFEGVYRGLFPKYEEKVVKHEAGHFLAAYLYGLAVRGYVLSAIEAFKAGIPGQAGTLFEDGEMYDGLKRGKVGGSVVDRFAVVSMAGIAAEAVHYGEAEGGESDMRSLLTLLTGLQPPWTAGDVRTEARWAVLEAVVLIRENERAFEALCEAMRQRKSLGECVLCIEDNIERKEEAVVGGADGEGHKNEQELLEEKERAIVAELERIRKQADHLERN